MTMLVQIIPDTITRLIQVSDTTIYEPVGDQPQQERRRAAYQAHSLEECITNVSTPKGGKKILKVMMTTACDMNCHYCPFRAGRSKMKRLTFTPDEVAKSLDTLQQAGKVEGMFLSSGIIKGSVTTSASNLLNVVHSISHARCPFQSAAHSNYCNKKDELTNIAFFMYGLFATLQKQVIWNECISFIIQHTYLCLL